MLEEQYKKIKKFFSTINTIFIPFSIKDEWIKIDRDPRKLCEGFLIACLSEGYSVH